MRFVLIAWVALLASPAFADENQARKHYAAGERAYKAQAFATAAEHFDAAFKEMSLPAIAFNAAQAYRRAYRMEPKLETARRALELYRAYIDKVKQGGKVGAAADYIGEMQREVDKLVAAGAKASRDSGGERTRLAISPVLSSEQRDGAMSEMVDLPETTEIKIVATLDGKPVTPYEMTEVEPGPHTVRVEAEGYLPHESTERAVKGSSKIAEITMKPKPAKLVVRTESGARVRVDGRAATGTTVEMPAGKHVVTVLKAGREAVSREIEVTRGQELVIDAPLAKTGRRRAVPFVATAAIVLGVATLAGATYAIVENERASDQLAAIQQGDQRPEAVDRYESLITRRDEVVTGAFVTGGAALLLGGAAMALYWLDRPSEESVRVTPAISGGATGISISGRF